MLLHPLLGAIFPALLFAFVTSALLPFAIPLHALTLIVFIAVDPAALVIPTAIPVPIAIFAALVTFIPIVIATVTAVIIISIVMAIAVPPAVVVIVIVIPVSAAVAPVGPPAIAVVVADANAMRLHNAAILTGGRERHGLGGWRRKRDCAGGHGSEQEKRLRHRFVLSC
jgi:hypothetical protein